MIYLAIIAWAILLGIGSLAWVAAVEIGKWRDRRWQSERPTRPTADPEWIAGLYDHPPIFAEVERDMGPIFAAGVERQAKRFAAELEDDGGIYDWLRGAS